ncbi:MAG: hypothetical protein EXQ71_07305 [Acidimicrobiia bacterium]|nr:hypothetical protein [Acidimicrobiia bacterium]
MNVKELRGSLRRHWAVPLVILLVVPIVMAGYLASRDIVEAPDIFTTSADVLIPARTEEDPSTTDSVPPVLLQGQNELANSLEVKEATLRAADLPDDLAEEVVLIGKLSEDRTLMILTVSGSQPDVAANVINDYIKAYQDGRSKSVADAANELQGIQILVIRRLTGRLQSVEGTMAKLGLKQLPRVADGDALAPVSSSTATNEATLLLYERNTILNEIQRRQVSFGSAATQSTAPGSYTTVVQRRSTARITPPPPSPLIPLVEILAIGLLLALAIPFGMDRLDATITEARSAPGILRASLLQAIPHIPRRLQEQFAPPDSAWGIAFRSLAATSISTDRLPKAIMVTSPSDVTQDAVAANFAVGLAGLGVSVALIGTVPRQRWFLHANPLDNEGGGEGGDRLSTLGYGELSPVAGQVSTFPELLADAQSGELTSNILTRLGTRAIPNLYIVPPGETGAELSLDGLPPLLDALAASGIDLVVIAGPALLEDPSATIMAWSTRHVLWAIEIGQANKSDANLAADRLELGGVDPFGIALVNRGNLRT